MQRRVPHAATTRAQTFSKYCVEKQRTGPQCMLYLLWYWVVPSLFSMHASCPFAIGQVMTGGFFPLLEG
jgi:hypothetical protein